MEVTRRNFLKGSLTAAAATAAAGALAACSPNGNASPASSTDAKATSAGEIKHTWEVAPEPIKDVAETKDYDIVIVGAGIAGNSAAEAAARNGAKVAVIERTDGIQMHGIDVAAIGSKFKIDNGVDIDIDEACRLLYLWSQQTTNYNLIRTWAEKTGPVIDYIEGMVAEQGFKMVSALSKTAKYGWETLPERWRVYPDAVSFVSDAEPGAVRSDKKTCNWNLGEALYKSATDNGAEYVFNTHAEQLVGDAKSGITGVIVTDANGKYVQYNASKGVILATGDISGNQEMVNCWARITTRADGNRVYPRRRKHWRWHSDGLLGWSCAFEEPRGTDGSSVHPELQELQSYRLRYELACGQPQWRALWRGASLRALFDQWSHEHPWRQGVVDFRREL